MPLTDRNLNSVDRRGREGEIPDASKRSWNLFCAKQRFSVARGRLVVPHIFFLTPFELDSNGVDFS